MPSRVYTLRSLLQQGLSTFFGYVPQLIGTTVILLGSPSFAREVEPNRRYQVVLHRCYYGHFWAQADGGLENRHRDRAWRSVME